MNARRRSSPLALAAVAFVAVALLAAGAALPARADQAPIPKLQTAVLAGGCFWGMEEVFESLRGVTGVVSGFSGGSATTAHYEDVSTGTTGQAESVQITYNPARISYDQLLDVFFTVAEDPTELNRQGPDEGSQYRSVIFYANDAQHRAALAAIAKLTAEKKFSAPIVTQVVPFHAFYAAEAYHQHYARLHPNDPYIYSNDAPKMAALRSKFPQLVSSL